jgi:hypothetical protein
MIKLKSIVITSLALILFPLLTFAQDSLSFAEIDSLSYKAYLKSDWRSVRKFTQDGMQSGYDYYYLRMRAGEAELNMHHPVKAIRHFRKALEFNDKDPVALELLYSSLLYSGDLAESRLLAASHSPAFRKRMGIPARRLITSAFVEPGYMVNAKAAELQKFQPDAELAHVYLVPNYWYLSAGFNLEAGKRFAGTLAANILSFSSIQQFTFQNQQPLVFDVPFDQKAFYLSGNYYLGKGFHAFLSGQLMSYTIPLYQWTEGDFVGQFIQDAYEYRDLALNASLVKRFPFLTIGLSADANKIKDYWYKQAGASLTIYPTGNVNTFFYINGTWLTGDSESGARAIYHAKAGRKLFRSVWLEGDYYYGDIRNYSEANAFVVFNNYDLIRNRLGASLLAYQVRPHLDLSIRYQFSRRLATWQIYQDSEYIGAEQQTYPVNSFIVGLTWRF